MPTLSEIIKSSDNKLTVKVTPKASSNRIKIEKQADGSSLIRVYVTCVPENGKANKDVIKLLAKELNVPKSSLEITQGSTSNIKTIKIH